MELVSYIIVRSYYVVVIFIYTAYALTTLTCSFIYTILHTIVQFTIKFMTDW